MNLRGIKTILAAFLCGATMSFGLEEDWIPYDAGCPAEKQKDIYFFQEIKDEGIQSDCAKHCLDKYTKKDGSSVPFIGRKSGSGGDKCICFLRKPNANRLARIPSCPSDTLFSVPKLSVVVEIPDRFLPVGTLGPNVINEITSSAVESWMKSAPRSLKSLITSRTVAFSREGPPRWFVWPHGCTTDCTSVVNNYLNRYHELYQVSVSVSFTKDSSVQSPGNQASAVQTFFREILSPFVRNLNLNQMKMAEATLNPRCDDCVVFGGCIQRCSNMCCRFGQNRKGGTFKHDGSASTYVFPEKLLIGLYNAEDKSDPISVLVRTDVRRIDSWEQPQPFTSFCERPSMYLAGSGVLAALLPRVSILGNAVSGLSVSCAANLATGAKEDPMVEEGWNTTEATNTFCDFCMEEFRSGKTSSLYEEFPSSVPLLASRCNAICFAPDSWYQHATEEDFTFALDSECKTFHDEPVLDLLSNKIQNATVAAAAAASVAKCQSVFSQLPAASTSPTGSPSNLQHDQGEDLESNPPSQQGLSSSTIVIFSVTCGTVLFLAASFVVFRKRNEKRHQEIVSML